MKYIEVLGASGVGKSFLLAESARGFKDHQYTQKEARLVCAEAIRKPSTSARRRLFRHSLRRTLPRSLQERIADSIFDNYAQKAVLNELDKYMDFCQVAIELAGISHKPSMLKLQALKRIHGSLSNIVAFGQLLPDNTVVVIDEPLSKHIYSMVSTKENNLRDHVAKYFETIPLPDALCHTTCDIDLHLSRIKQRNHVVYTLRHAKPDELRSMVEKLQEISRIGRDIMKRRGAKVIDIDTTADVAENQERLIHFCDKL